MEIRPAAGESDLAAVRGLWREYWDSLGLPDDFQGFAEELRGLPGAYAGPHGALLLAIVDGAVAGTVALRPLREDAAEAKRLYVRPAYRGRGIGRALVARVTDAARTAGRATLYADTLPGMRDALGMYERLGFRETSAYSPHPTPGALYLCLPLDGSAATGSPAASTG